MPADQNPTPAAQNKRQMAEQIYNSIMGPIEEDLLLENIALLDEKYKNETKAEHDKRMERYAEAYNKFDEEMAKFVADVNQEEHSIRREALKQKESDAQKDDEAALGDIESALQ